MSLLLQISDTHFGTEQPRVVEALVALAQALQPDMVVLSGTLPNVPGGRSSHRRAVLWRV